MLWKCSRYATYLPIAFLIMSCVPGQYAITFPPPNTSQTTAPSWQQPPPGGAPGAGYGNPPMGSPSPAFADVTPPASPVIIWVPTYWKQDPRPIYFDLVFTEPNQDVGMFFKFMNGNTQAALTQQLYAYLNNKIYGMTASGAPQNIQINGMPAQFQEYRGVMNATRGTVDVAVSFVRAPWNNIVCVAAIGMSNKTSQYSNTTQMILTSLRPR